MFLLQIYEAMAKSLKFVNSNIQFKKPIKYLLLNLNEALFKSHTIFTIALNFQ